MDHKQFSASYGNVEDYFYNSASGNVVFDNLSVNTILTEMFTNPEYNDLYDNDLNDQYNTNEDIYSDMSFWKNLSFYELCAQCVLPGVWSTFNILATNLVLCILFVICKFIKIIIRPIYEKHYIISGNKFKIFTESILHLICAVCGVLPIILFHESTDLYQLLLQMVFMPIFCYIISIIFILYLKRYSAIVLSTIILLALFYR